MHPATGQQCQGQIGSHSCATGTESNPELIHTAVRGRRSQRCNLMPFSTNKRFQSKSQQKQLKYIQASGLGLSYMDGWPINQSIINSFINFN